MPERNISRRRNTILSAEWSVDTSSSPALLPAKKNLGESPAIGKGSEGQGSSSEGGENALMKKAVELMSEAS